MTLYDSSVLIGYLDGDPNVVEYVERHADDRAVAPPLVMFEVYQGEGSKAIPRTSMHSQVRLSGSR